MPYQYKRERLSDNEVNRLTNACETFEEEFVVWTLLDTGLRVSEFANLKKKIRSNGRSAGSLFMVREDLTGKRPNEGWLRGINESAADSLMEAFEDILTLHRLKVPGLLRKTLTCTNPIESMFSTVRDCEGNIKRYRNSAMSQRWLATVLLHCEKGFRRVKGYLGIAEVIATIEQIQEGIYAFQKAA